MDSSRAPAIPRLGVAAWGWWNESNHGVNASTLTPTGNATVLTNTTSYPSDLAMGSTWDRGLVHTEAGLIGDEARDTAPGHIENLDFYAPTVNLSRDPRWGRNDESWSEDPTLTAALAGQYVDGLQGQTMKGTLPASANGYYKALATLKHYAANNSEVNRRSGSSDMDQRTLREYYTKQFADIIEQAHPASIMSSYNEVNGVPAAASVQLMKKLARETYGFRGYFTSDCDAVYEIQAGHHWQPPNASAPLDQYGRSAYASPPVRTSTATPATTTSTATGTPSRPRSASTSPPRPARSASATSTPRWCGCSPRASRPASSTPRARCRGCRRPASASAARPGSATRPTTRSPRPRSDWRRRARARTRAWCC